MFRVGQYVQGTIGTVYKVVAVEIEGESRIRIENPKTKKTHLVPANDLVPYAGKHSKS